MKKFNRTIPPAVWKAAVAAPYGLADRILEPFIKADRRRAIMGNKTKFKIAARKKRKA
jgi:hypothetical protein